MKTYLIFGGTGELFGNIALELAKLDSTIYIVGRCEAKASAITSQHANIHFIKYDASCEDVSDVFAQIPHYDVLINGMGVNSATPFEEITEAEMAHIMKVNYIIPAQCCQIAAKYMAARKSGFIINVGSISAITPLSKVFTYSASKAALHNLTKNLAREYGGEGVNINTLVPGFFPAAQNRTILSKDRVNQILAHTPANRFGEPKDLLGAVLLLSSSSFVNGAEIVVDGGFHATKI